MRCSRGGNSSILHQRFREPLRGLNFSRGLRWSEDRPACRTKCVDYPNSQRSFGTNECQVYLSPLGEPEEAFDVILLDGYAVGELGDSGVPLGADDLDRRIILLELPRNGVFASAVADEEDFQAKACSTSASRSSSSSTPHDSLTSPSVMPSCARRSIGTDA